jgi:VWA domain-containing protein
VSLANLTLGQFFTLFGVASAFVVLLYLLDRTRRRQVVATLRFWTEASSPVETRRWRVHQPLSLLLQLLGLFLLLLAVAQLQTGASEESTRDHVIVMDTSAWMAASTGGETWMEQARSQALGYLQALPRFDRVMILHAGATVTPATSFETDRGLLEDAVKAATPGVGGLDLTDTLEIADRVLRLHGQRPGEVVFVGPGYSLDSNSGQGLEITNLRFLPVVGDIENVALHRVGLYHSPDVPNEWEVYVAVRNGSAVAREVEVSAEFAASPAVYRRLSLGPSEERQFTFPLRTRAAGLLDVRILNEDGFSGDNTAVLEVPAREPLRVCVRSRRPQLLRPLLSASPLVEATYRNPDDPAQDDTDILILDNCLPPEGSTADTIWIRPPQAGSPVPVLSTVANVIVERWRVDHPAASGLQTPDLVLDRSQIFAAGDGDAVLAEGAPGAVAVASEGGDPGRKSVVLGFHPAESGMRNDLSSPLLFANIVRWMKPDVFRRWELNAGSAGLVTVPVGADLTEDAVLVQDEAGQDLSFTLDGGMVRFYSGREGAVTVQAGDRQIVCSLGLPPSPETAWEPPESALQGVPPAAGGRFSRVDWWPWLVLLGGLALLVEWLMFGRSRRQDAAARISWNRVGDAQ